MNKTLSINDIYVMLSAYSDSDKQWLADRINTDMAQEAREQKVAEIRKQKLAKLKFPHIPKNRKILPETLEMVIGKLPNDFDFEKETEKMWEELAQ